jgi:hypothetical protein
VDALDLLFRRLVLAARAADALARPLEVGEILDRHVPYRAARRDGLLDSNDDYLHVVMQLLAGERELVFADDLMQDDLRNELKSPNPDLQVLRTYASAKVRLSTAAVQRVLEGDTQIDLRPSTPISTDAVSAASAPRPDAGSGVSPVPGREQPAVASPTPVLTPVAPAAESEVASCPYCAQRLPTDRPVRFCPGCGINLRVRRCPGCSTEIESEWKYCVTCGRSAA